MKEVILSGLKINLKKSEILRYLSKGFKKSKIAFDRKRQLNWRNYLFDVCLTHLIMCKKGWCVRFG